MNMSFAHMLLRCAQGTRLICDALTRSRVGARARVKSALKNSALRARPSPAVLAVVVVVDAIEPARLKTTAPRLCSSTAVGAVHAGVHREVDVACKAAYVCLQGGGGQRGQARTTMERAERGYQHVATSKYAASQ